MTAKAVAEQILKWATANRIYDSFEITPVYDTNLIATTFASAGLLSATSVLQDRRIAYIGVNETTNEVIIHLERPLRVKDRRALAKVGNNNVTVTFHSGGTLQSGTMPVPPVGVAPYLVGADGAYRCGSSVYVANQKGAGTLGCLVRSSDGHLLGLSNNHVLAGNNYAERGIPISAPGSEDIAAFGLDPFTLGHLCAAAPLTDGVPAFVNVSANIDAAAMLIVDPQKVSSMQRDFYDTPSSVTDPVAGMSVEKVGRTTGRTRGAILSHYPFPQEVRAIVDRIASRKHIFFEDIWGVCSASGPFSQPGDSGSLVTTIDATGTRLAVGLIFAGGDRLSFVVPIRRVLEYFGFDLVSGHNI